MYRICKHFTGRTGFVREGLFVAVDASPIIYIKICCLWLRISKGGLFLFVDRTAKIWDLNRGDEIMSLAGHKRDVTVVRYSPITNLVFTVNQSTIKVSPFTLKAS